MDSLGEYHQLEGIHCPTCSGPYDLIRILGRYGRSYKLLVRCPSCNIYGIGTAQIVNTAKGPHAYRAAAAPSSMRPTPAVRSDEPISGEDVLAMHEFLRSFNGDFRALWASRSES